MKKILISAVAIFVMAGATSKVMAQERFSLSLKATPLFSFFTEQQ